MFAFLFLLILLAIFLFALAPRMAGKPDASALSGWYYAHRGLHDNKGAAPENSLAAVRNAVEKGYGISFLPDYVTKKRREKGKLVYLKVKNFEIELWKQILYHKNKWLSLQMQAVIHHFGSIMLQK